MKIPGHATRTRDQDETRHAETLPRSARYVDPAQAISDACESWGVVLCFAPGNMNDIICSAIRDCQLLEFDYDGHHRVVAPYCHGFTRSGEALRAVQIAGSSHSRRLKSGKLWAIEKMQNLRRLGESFAPDDPHYNPADRAMTTIHCRVQY